MIGSCPEDSNRHQISDTAQHTLRSLSHSDLSACLFRPLSFICYAWPGTSRQLCLWLCLQSTRPGTKNLPGPGSLQGSKSTGVHAPHGPPLAKASRQSSLWLWCCEGMCVYLGGRVCVISVVLNDSCSICYWVALLEISRGFNAESELRSWKAACGAAGRAAVWRRSGQDQGLTELNSFPNVRLLKKPCWPVSTGPILSHRGPVRTDKFPLDICEHYI